MDDKTIEVKREKKQFKIWIQIITFINLFLLRYTNGSSSTSSGFSMLTTYSQTEKQHNIIYKEERNIITTK